MNRTRLTKEQMENNLGGIKIEVGTEKPITISTCDTMLYCPVCRKLQRVEIESTLAKPEEATRYPDGWSGEIQRSTVCCSCRTTLVQQTAMGWLDKKEYPNELKTILET